MNSASRGFRFGTELDAAPPSPLADVGGSVLSLIHVSFGIFGRRFVDHRLADPVFLARPVAEVQ